MIEEAINTVLPMATYEELKKLKKIKDVEELYLHIHKIYTRLYEEEFCKLRKE